MAKNQYSADSAHHPHPTLSGRLAVCDDKPPALTRADDAVSAGFCRVQGREAHAMFGTPARAHSPSINPINRT
jgi:hypothetical protein